MTPRISAGLPSAIMNGIRNHEWGNVLHDLGATAEYRVPADAAELMHSAEAADDSMVFDDDVAGESAVVGKDDVVPNSAVMSNVRISEKIVVTADHGFCIRHRATIHGAKLAEAVVIADLEERRLTGIFEILSALANGAKGKKTIGSPDFGGARPR